MPRLLLLALLLAVLSQLVASSPANNSVPTSSNDTSNMTFVPSASPTMVENKPLSGWVDMDGDAKGDNSRIVGASVSCC